MPETPDRTDPREAEARTMTITLTPAQANAAERVAHLREGYADRMRDLLLYASNVTVIAHAAARYPWPKYATEGPPVERVRVDGSYESERMAWWVRWNDGGSLVCVDGCGSMVSINRDVHQTIKRAAAKLLLAEPTTIRYRVKFENGRAVAEPITGEGV